jgi:hypothetical protein
MYTYLLGLPTILVKNISLLEFMCCSHFNLSCQMFVKFL